MAFNKDDCKALYLIYHDTTQENVKNRKELTKMLRESGRHVTEEILSRYWKPDKRDLTYDEYINICRDLPIITKTDLVKHLKKLDLKGYGFLDKNEFVEIMTKENTEISRRDLLEIVNKVDVNEDGKLKFEELANILLSNLEPFRKMARQKSEEKEEKGSRKSVSGAPSRSGSVGSRVNISPQNPVQPSAKSKSITSKAAVDDDDDDDDVVIDSKSQKVSESENGILIEQITLVKFDFKQPKNLKAWKQHTFRGCLFLGDDSSDISAQNLNIESYTYNLSLNSSANVLFTLSPLTVLQRLDLKKVPDLGFVVLNKDKRVVGLSIPSDSNGAIYYSGNLNAGAYSIIPFTTGAKLKSRSEDGTEQWKNLRIIKKDEKGELNFSDDIKTVLEDIFKICDTDGNGYLNKDEFKWYSAKTSEEDWDEELWNELKDVVKLHNNELSFAGFTKLMMEEVKQEKMDPASLFSTLDLFGFNDKFMLEEAFPFSLSLHVENADYLAQCNGISSEASLIESSLCDFVVEQGEKVTSKVNWPDCAQFLWCKGGRILLAVANKNHSSKPSPLRLSINMEKSTNLCVYKDKMKRTVTIPNGKSKLAVHGVPIESKVSISLSCLIKRN